jgi:hypothetical protein
MDDIERSQLVKDLRQLTKKFSQGWHEGIKIDATDIALLSEASLILSEQPELSYFGLTHNYTWISITKEEYDNLQPRGRMACYIKVE